MGEYTKHTTTFTLTILLGFAAWCVCIADPAADLKKSGDLIAAKQYDQAIKLLTAVESAKSPLAPQALEMIGDCYRLEENFAKAASCYERVLAEYKVDDAQATRVGRWLIKCHIRNRDWGKAEAEVDAIAAKSPAYASSWWYFSLGKHYLRFLDYRKGVDAFVKVISLCKEYPEATFVNDARKLLVQCRIGAGDWDEAVKLIAELAPEFPEEAPLWHACAGAVYQGRGDYPKAIEELKQAIDAESAVDARKRLGQCYQASLGAAEAAPLIQTIIDKHPKDGPYLPLMVGQLYQGIKEYDKAIASYDFVIANCPDNRWQVWDAFFFRAECLYPLGRGDEAMTDIEKFYAKHADRPLDLAIARGRVLAECAQKPAEAADVLAQALAKNPEEYVSRDMRKMLVSAYVDSGQTDKAAESIRLSMQTAQAEEKLALAETLARIYFEAKDYHKAIVAYKGLLDTPNASSDLLASANYQTAQCYYFSGLPTSAKRYMQRVSERFPDTEWAKKSSLVVSMWADSK